MWTIVHMFVIMCRLFVWLLLQLHYLAPAPGPSPLTPLPPGESMREMLRRWEVRKPKAITPSGVPTGSEVPRSTEERSWECQSLDVRDGLTHSHLFVCVCVCHSHQLWPCAKPRRSVFLSQCRRKQLGRVDCSWIRSSWWRQTRTVHWSFQTDLVRHTEEIQWNCGCLHIQIIV